jgi:hypothetical protein
VPVDWWWASGPVGARQLEVLQIWPEQYRKEISDRPVGGRDGENRIASACVLPAASDVKITLDGDDLVLTEYGQLSDETDPHFSIVTP